jgi:hypothetical protein
MEYSWQPGIVSRKRGLQMFVAFFDLLRLVLRLVHGTALAHSRGPKGSFLERFDHFTVEHCDDEPIGVRTFCSRRFNGDEPSHS